MRNIKRAFTLAMISALFMAPSAAHAVYVLNCIYGQSPSSPTAPNPTLYTNLSWTQAERLIWPWFAIYLRTVGSSSHPSGSAPVIEGYYPVRTYPYTGLIVTFMRVDWSSVWTMTTHAWALNQWGMFQQELTQMQCAGFLIANTQYNGNYDGGGYPNFP